MGQSTPLGLFISLDNWIQGKIQICQYVCSHFSCGDIGDTDRDTQMGRAATLGLARSASAPFLRQFGARAFLTGDMFYFHLAGESEI